jgi:hypothetical protein
LPGVVPDPPGLLAGTLPPVIRTAELRVYEPSPDASERLPPEPRPPGAPTMGAYGLIGESFDDRAHVIVWHGRRYVCRRRTRLRVLEGVVAIDRAHGALGVGFVPETVATRARLELAELLETDPHARSAILTSAFHVPLRWFVPFDPSERLLESHPSAPGVRYRTDLAAARSRVGRALAVLRSAGVPDAVADEVAGLDAWLAGFQGDRVLELDYGGVARMFSLAELEADRSAADVWNTIEALADEDWVRAGEHYGTLVARWSDSMAVCYSS